MIEEKRLARAYLAGVKATCESPMTMSLWDFHAAEQARLNKRASKRGKDRT